MRRLRTGLDKDDTIIRRHRRRRPCPRPRPRRRLRRRCRRRAVADHRRSRGKGVATSRSRTFAPGAPGKTRLRGIPLSGPPTRPLSRVPLYFLLLLRILPYALLRLSHPSVPHSTSPSLPTLRRLGGDQGSLFSPPTALPASLPPFLATTAGAAYCRWQQGGRGRGRTATTATTTITTTTTTTTIINTTLPPTSLVSSWGLYPG